MTTPRRDPEPLPDAGAIALLVALEGGDAWTGKFGSRFTVSITRLRPLNAPSLPPGWYTALDVDGVQDTPVAGTSAQATGCLLDDDGEEVHWFDPENPHRLGKPPLKLDRITHSLHDACVLAVALMSQSS